MVYYCSVKGCKNNSKMKKKDPNIVLSFHAFPVKETTKQKWLRAIGRPCWKPPSFARICSAHFDLDQISHEGFRIRVIDDAYPVNGLPPNSNFEASEIEVCRICLATDLKMFNIQERMLNTCLKSFARLKENYSIEGLPQFVCYECSARLINCYSLIEQCSISQAVLLDLFTKNGQVSKSLVKTQDRKSLGLESSLQCYNITNTYEYTFNEEYTVKKDPNNKTYKDAVAGESNNTDRQFAVEKDHIYNKTDKDTVAAERDSERQLKTDLYAISEIEKEISKEDFDEELDRKMTATNKFEITKPKIQKTKRTDYSGQKVIVLADSYDSFDSTNDFTIESNHDIKTRLKTKKCDDNTKEKPKYPCEECDIDFASEEARRVHLLTSKIHRKQPDVCNPSPPKQTMKTTCSKCCSQFFTAKELIVHLKTEHPRPKRSLRSNIGYPLKCEHCEDTVSSRGQHWLHVRRRHPEKKHTYRAQHNSICQRCGKQFQNSTKLRVHELRHSAATLRCPRCARAFHDKYALARHAHTHSRGTHACPLCARPFTNKHNLMRHQRVHTGETPYACHLCSKRFKHSTSQQHHIRSVHCNLPSPKRNKTLEIDSNRKEDG